MSDIEITLDGPTIGTGPVGYTVRDFGCIRLSNVVKAVGLTPDTEAFASELQDWAKAFVCSECDRAEPDPIVGYTPDNQFAAWCPRCSGQAVRTRWENEIPGSFERDDHGYGTVLVTVRPESSKDEAHQ